MAHVHCMLDNQVCKYILRICNTYWFSAAAMVIPIHLNVTLYVHCLSCLYFYSAAVNINVPLYQCQHIMCMSAIFVDLYSLTMISTEQWLDLQNSTLTSHCILNTTFRHERGRLLCMCSLNSRCSYSEWSDLKNDHLRTHIYFVYCFVYWHACTVVSHVINIL